VLPAGATVATYGQAIRWVLAALKRVSSPRQGLTSKLVKQPAGYALIHGDTLSTLLGLYLSRRLGLRVGLIEAGLSSGNRLDPFPEELIRRHVERRADILFAPDQGAAARLIRRLPKGNIVSTGYNTGRDALLITIDAYAQRYEETKPVSTVLTLHRAETLGRRSQLRKIIHHVVRLAPEIGPIRFFLHEPTRRALARTRLLETLSNNPNFELVPLGSYPEFTNALARASYVLTDGGSIQEEASYLGKRCLILRRTTERQQGIGTTAMLTSLDVDEDLTFLRSGNQAMSDMAKQGKSLDAARIIVDHLYSDWLERPMTKVEQNA
jgi:UDP-N-acetylglucosamine 2-epimerase (non-hydrolysing)